MDRTAITKIILVAALIVAYVIVAALEINQTVLAPIIVAAIALILFLPRRRDKTGEGPGSGS